ncbi:DNA topoisomerase [Gongronella butleri]|nr:DNA topoisomerase [Gongronella butleri]
MAPCNILMVAEKPSLADALSRLLAPGGQFETRKSVTPVHEWLGKFRGSDAHFKFTSVTGHVYNTDFTQENNSWQVDPQILFTAVVKKTEANPKMHLTDHLRREAKHVDYLILWLDCDREGENICFEVIDNCLSNMNKSSMNYVLRAKFSAITQQDVRRAMDNLVKPNQNEARAVDARQEFDLKVGVAFTRFQTRFFQGKYGDLDSTLISYGPCQTPTLSFCVERHDRIQSFQPEPFWSIAPTIVKNESQIKLSWMRERLFDKQVTSVLMTSVESALAQGAKVTQVAIKKNSKSRPHALNTVELLKHGSAVLGISPSECMSIAERLYMQGYISYPRTETDQYPDNFDLDQVLHEQRRQPDWGQFCETLLREGYTRPTGGKDVGDHPPITPMRLAMEGDLPGDMWRVYDFITRTFIGSLSPNLKYTSTHVVFAIGPEEFECRGSQVTSPGFAAVMHWIGKSDEYIPEFTQGEVLTVKSVQMTEGKTSPPDYLTEAELIGLMEQNGIGTDASIPTHINNICQRNYVNVGSGRRMIPTNLGIVLIHGYQKIDNDLSLPRMRSDMEQQLSLIATGKASFTDVLQYFLELFAKKFAYFVNHINSMDELFEATFSPLAATGRPLSKCGKCRRYMKYISLKPNRLHCATCDETYSLPLNGTIKLYRELTCPLDDFELVLYSTGSKGTGYPLCPYCYNHPPFENVPSKMGCNHCPHPTCTHSMVKNAVCPCPESEGETQCAGSLILDATSAPRWKLSCNACNIVSSFVDTIKNVTLADEVCECGAGIMKAEFRENQNREPVKGCILCDDEMDALLSTRFARKSIRRGFRGKKKGRRKKFDPHLQKLYGH